MLRILHLSSTLHTSTSHTTDFDEVVRQLGVRLVFLASGNGQEKSWQPKMGVVTKFCSFTNLQNIIHHMEIPLVSTTLRVRAYFCLLLTDVERTRFVLWKNRSRLSHFRESIQKDYLWSSCCLQSSLGVLGLFGHRNGHDGSLYKILQNANPSTYERFGIGLLLFFRLLRPSRKRLHYLCSKQGLWRCRWSVEETWEGWKQLSVVLTFRISFYMSFSKLDLSLLVTSLSQSSLYRACPAILRSRTRLFWSWYSCDPCRHWKQRAYPSTLVWL